MNKFRILIILLFGSLLMPNGVFACEKNSVSHSSRKEISSKMCNNNCCKKDNYLKNKNHDCCKGKHKCNGKCGHSNCVTTSSTQFGIVFHEMQFKNNDFVIYQKEQNYFKSNINLSSGFYSLWLIPKIS